MPSSLDRAEKILQSVWGYGGFRPPQRRAVLAALTGRDCLAILPTGGGKSLCYQVPALILPGLTLVVSPLISLMQDQVAALKKRGVAAEYLSSTWDAAAQDVVRQRLAAGALKLLYAAPERLGRLAKQIGPVSLLAVDEAHCISEWGHDFRPHYREIGGCRRALGCPPTLALTATATTATRADIIAVLGLRRPVTVVTSFDRPNLRLAVRRFTDEGARLEALRRMLREVDGTAVVYTPTRNRTDGVTAVLRRWGFAASPYHAGLPADARRDLLSQFLDGRIRVMVATTAFGMGIDKPDVRLVVHLGIPQRPESYYQEAGRAGRDGQPACCELFWLPRDLAFHAGEPPVMRQYVRTRGCRRRLLLDYLGEHLTGCAGCDNCP